MLEFSQNNGVSAEGSPNTPVRSVPIAEWTIADRAAWERAIAPRDRLHKGGAGAHLAPVTQDDLARRYGYFIDHLIRNDLFKPDAPPAGQVTPDRVETFVEELRGRVGSVTTASTIYKLRRVAELLDPNRDITWLAETREGFGLDDAAQIQGPSYCRSRSSL